MHAHINTSKKKKKKVKTVEKKNKWKTVEKKSNQEISASLDQVGETTDSPH